MTNKKGAQQINPTKRIVTPYPTTHMRGKTKKHNSESWDDAHNRGSGEEATLLNSNEQDDGTLERTPFESTTERLLGVNQTTTERPP